MPGSNNEVITRDPDVIGGARVFTGTRVPFQTFLGYIENGQTLNEFLDDFPTVTRDAAVHALEYAKSLVVSPLRDEAPARRVIAKRSPRWGLRVRRMA